MRGVLTVLFIVITSGSLLRAGTKEPLAIRLMDSTSRIYSDGMLLDTDDDECWDELRLQAASGSVVTHSVIDGQCASQTSDSPHQTGEIHVSLVHGSVESDAFTIALAEVESGKVLGLLIKDSKESFASFVPGSWTMQSDPSRRTSPIGIQMSLDGDRALIAVPATTTASVQLVQPNGVTTALYAGELHTGNTTIDVPSEVGAGTYVLSVVTDAGTQSVSFRLQR